MIGDNFFYRLAVHVFVGATAGYAAVVAFNNVIWPLMLAPFTAENCLQPDQCTYALLDAIDAALVGNVVGFTTYLVPAIGLVLALLLLLKARSTASGLGSWAAAFLVGVGSAVAIGGAITGTLIPQIQATAQSPYIAGALSLERLAENAIILVGTISTLAYFFYSVREGGDGLLGRLGVLVKANRVVAQIFMGTAFGVIFAGALVASLSMFVERMDTMWNTFNIFLPK